MKKTTNYLSLALFLLTINFSFSQEVFYDKNYKHASFFTEKRDTLFLIDDSIGHLIKTIWDDDVDKKEFKKPTIIFKTSIWIEEKWTEEKRKSLSYENNN